MIGAVSANTIANVLNLADVASDARRCLAADDVDVVVLMIRTPGRC